MQGHQASGCIAVAPGRALALVLVGVALLLPGCTTVEAGTGGGGRVFEALPPDIDKDTLEEAAEAELTRTVAQVESIAGGEHRVGTQLSFTFWTQRGALTLVQYEASGGGAPAGPPVDAGKLRETLRTVLSRYIQRRHGAAMLGLRREAVGWAVDYQALPSRPRPPEARTLPVRRTDVPTALPRTLRNELERVLRTVEVPQGGATRLEVEALLEDGQLRGWELQGFRVTHPGMGGQPQALTRRTADEVEHLILPFMGALGPREVRLALSLEHRPPEPLARGRVESARVWRPPPPAEMSEDFAAQYRALHEDILRRWQEDVEEGAEWLAQRGAEELALWYAGGILAKGASVLAGATVGTVLRALGRGGEAAAGWLRSAAARLLKGDKKSFERLWTKVQLEGEHALTSAERGELRALMERVEQLIHTPLDPRAKDKLREAARARYRSRYPHLAKLMDEAPNGYPVHHRTPLEYAHLTPGEDINATDNLVMVSRAVHERINNAWTQFRKLRPNATTAEVQRASALLDEQFGAWYHQAGEPPGLSKSLEAAEEAALQGLRRYFGTTP